MNTNNKVLKLFLTFLKIGAFTFGGGYAMIPLIHREAAEKNNWVTDEEIIEMLAISESTPGPIAINSATFVGCKVAGFWGAAFATLGVIIPSLVIITVIAFFLRSFSEYKAVRYAFTGIRAGVAALVIRAFITMSKKCPKNILAYIFVLTAFVLVTFFDISAVLIIACGGAAGLILTFAFSGKGEGK